MEIEPSQPLTAPDLLADSIIHPD